MVKVYEKIYPDYITYRGTAYKGAIEWGMLSFLDVNWLIKDIIEFNVRNNGGELLYVVINQKEDTQTAEYGLIHNYEAIFYFYQKPGVAVVEEVQFFFPWETIIILVLIALIAIAVYWALKEAKKVIWGPGGEQSLIPYALLIGSIGVAALGIGYLIPRARGAIKREVE